MFIYNCKNHVLFKRVLFEYRYDIINIVFINILNPVTIGWIFTKL